MTVNYTYVGVEAPSTLTINVSRGNSSVDLTTVTAASLSVRKPDTNVDVTWTASISSQTTTALTLSHTFAGPLSLSGPDLNVDGCYRFMILLTVPGGTLRAGPDFLEVLR